MSVPRATALPASERRSRAIEALLQLACDCPPEQISTAAIAERMGISHAALFRHFPSREVLWAESVRWATGQLEVEQIAIAADASLHPRQRVEQILLRKAEFICRHPGLLRMFLSELPRPGSSPASEEAKAFMLRQRERLTVLLEQTGAADHLPAAALASLLLASCQGLMLQGLMLDDLSALPDRIRALLPLLLAQS